MATEGGTGKREFPFVAAVSNSQLDAIQDAERKAAEEEARQAEPQVNGLVRYLKSIVEDAKRVRQESGVEDEMIAAMEQRAGKYDADTQSKIEEIGAPDIFMRLTDTKCRAACAWTHDVLGFEMERPLSFKPSPIPNLPADAVQGIIDRTMKQVYASFVESGQMPEPEDVFNFSSDMRDSIFEQIDEEALIRAKRMETVVYDQMLDGGWKKAFSEFVENLSTFPCGFLKGPIVRLRKKYDWRQSGKNFVPNVHSVAQIEWEAPSPLDMYPSRGAVDCNDGDLCERVRYSRRALAAMKGAEGYNDDAIDAALLRYGEHGLSHVEPIDSNRSELSMNGGEAASVPGQIEGWEIWASVQGKTLIEGGLSKDQEGRPIHPLTEYDANCIMIEDLVLFCSLNADPLDQRPYYKESWASRSNSFWGMGVPQIMADIQRVCNATMRALVMNEGIAAGDQYVYPDISRLPPGYDITEVYPGKVHQFTNLSQAGEKPLYTLRVESHAAELQGVYISFAKLADEYTGIPAYEQGLPTPGVGRTASGLSMLMSNAARHIKYVIMRIDQNVLEAAMRRQYEWNMLYNPDQSIKGDVQIEPEGVLSRIIREQMSQRRMEFLNVTNNPTDQELMATTGRAKVLREAAKTLDMADDIVRPEPEIKALAAKRQAMLEQARQQQMKQLVAGSPA